MSQTKEEDLRRRTVLFYVSVFRYGLNLYTTIVTVNHSTLRLFSYARVKKKRRKRYLSDMILVQSYFRAFERSRCVPRLKFQQLFGPERYLFLLFFFTGTYKKRRNVYKPVVDRCSRSFDLIRERSFRSTNR